MSAGYDLFALGGLASLQGNLPLLNALGLAPPFDGAATRGPTLAEVKSALDGLQYAIDSENMRGTDLILWARSPDQGGIEITIPDYSTQPGEEIPRLSLHFEKGTPRMLVAIARQLAHNCGTLLLMEETMTHIVVSPDTDPDAPWISP